MIVQLLTAVAAAGVSLIWDLTRGNEGLPQAVAALAAGMACVVPAGLYAWRAQVERSASRFLVQGVLKFLLTVMLLDDRRSGKQDATVG